MIRYIFYVFGCVAAMLSISCHQTTPVQPEAEIPSIDNIPSYNEAYRDSILVLDWQGILIVHKSGTGLRRLSTLPALAATWSPRKGKVLVTLPDRLSLVNPDGQNERVISRQPERFRTAMSSPDGRKIAFVSKDPTDSNLSRGWIRVMLADGSREQTLTPIQPSPNDVTWTLDSKFVVFNGADSAGSGLFFVPADGGETKCLYWNSAGMIGFPSVSPNGALIAFDADVEDGHKLFTLDLQSGNVVQLTNGTSFDSEASWSPDGTSLVYTRSEQVAPYSWQAETLWILNLATRQWSLLIPQGQTDYYNSCWQQ